MKKGDKIEFFYKTGLYPGVICKQIYTDMFEVLTGRDHFSIYVNSSSIKRSGVDVKIRWDEREIYRSLEFDTNCTIWNCCVLEQIISTTNDYDFLIICKINSLKNHKHMSEYLDLLKIIKNKYKE